MIVGVAVCPGAPLLVPGLTPALATEVPDLLKSCAAAVSVLAGADRILLVTSGPRVRDPGAADTLPAVVHPPGTPVSSALLTDSRAAAHFCSRLAGAPAASVTSASVNSVSPTPGTVTPGVGVVVGAALLDRAGLRVPTTAIELGEPAGGLGIVRRTLEGSADRVGLLVIGEGTGSRGAESPGGGHPNAEAIDTDLAGALRTGDPAALARAATVDPLMATSLVWTAGPSLAVLAQLCLDREPPVANLLYDDAPFGVGYLVATWVWPDPAPARRATR